MDIIFYKLQDEINDVKKLRTLTAREDYTPLQVSGTLKGATSKVAPSIDFSKPVTYFNGYNYCYIADFNRYYFVTDMVSNRTEYTTVDLRVDVLTSFLTQSNMGNLEGYVFRSQNKGLKTIYDDRVPLLYQRTIREWKPDNITNNIVNFSFLDNNGDVTGGSLNYVFEILNKDQYYTPVGNSTPTILGQPMKSIMPTVVQSQFCAYNQSVIYATTLNNIAQVLTKCIKDTTFKSNVKYITAYPFKPITIGDYPSGMVNVVYGKDNDTIDYTIGGNTVHVEALKVMSATSNYLVIADFLLDTPTNIVENTDKDFTVLDKSLVKYELWLPYYGWVNIPCEYRGHRITVYYSINYSDGTGTVNVASFSSNAGTSPFELDSATLIISKQIQLGVKIPVDASNNQELQARKQASLLNTVVGVGAGALVTAAGYYTKNYRTMAYGAGAIGSSLINYANTQIKAIDQSEAVVPSGDSGLYLPQEVRVKFSYNAKQTNFDRTTFEKFNGYPCGTTYKLSELSGYAEVDRLHTSNTVGSVNYYIQDITYTETGELESLLSKGVYF